MSEERRIHRYIIVLKEVCAQHAGSATVRHGYSLFLLARSIGVEPALPSPIATALAATGLTAANTQRKPGALPP